MGRAGSALLLGFLVGCAPVGEELPGLQVESAQLEGLSLTSVGLLGGPVWGSAWLVVQSPDPPYELRFPVDLRGAFFGLGVEMDLDGFAPDRVIPLELPSATVPGDDLLGAYRGGSFGLSLGAGFDHHRLRNASGVAFRPTFLSVGLSAMIGGEWLRIDLSEPARLDRPTTTLDSGTPDTGGPDTALEGASSGGCQCASSDAEDSGAPPETGGPDADPRTGPWPAAPARRACASGRGSAPSGALLGLLVAWAWRRRR
jgi:hypothetical protein